MPIGALTPIQILAMDTVQSQLYLLYGVNTIDSSEQEPSELKVEESAFGVLKSSKNLFVVAAAPLSKGKIVSVAHEGFVNRQYRENDDSYLLVRNIFRWFTVGSHGAPNVGLLVDGYDNLFTNLQAVPFTVSRITPTSQDLANVEAVFTTCYVHYTEEQLAAIRQFVTNGGGLLVGGHNWANPTDYANQILFGCGITITKSYGGGYEMYKVPNPEYQLQLFMLHNVCEINSKGQEASALTVSGNAIGVLWTAANKITVAAASFSQGRITEVGHEGYVNRKHPLQGTTDDSYILIQNIVRWLSKCKKAAVVGVIPNGYDNFCTNMSSAGYTVKHITPTENDLKTVDVVLATCYTKYTQDQCSAVRSFVTGGGGLLLCGHNWYHKTDYANDLLFDSGITITTSYSKSEGTVYSVLPNPPTQ